MVESFLEMIETLGSTVMGWVLMITGSGSFITVVALALKFYSLTKKNKTTEMNSQVKDEIIKAKEEEIANTNKRIDDIVIGMTLLSSVVNAMALNSGVGIETKQYIASQHEELRKMFPKAKKIEETNTAPILEEAKELEDSVKKTAAEHVEKSKELSQDVLNVYSKIVNAGE